MADVTWTPTARQHLADILSRIAWDSPRLGEKWAAKIEKATDILERFPEIGSPVEDSKRKGYREQIVRPYRIIYRYDGTVCHVIAVLHAKQDIDRWLPPDDAP